MSSSLIADTTSRPEPAPQALPLVARVCEELTAAHVAYCHWKSNAAIDRSASGDNDLDLLVARRDIRRLTELLSGLGFVRAGKRASSVPGIESFFGFDAEADRLVHVHAHYQLVLGDDRTKNYRVPVEEAYIASSEQAGLFRLPAPEFEYVIFVIRMVLKYCTWDEIAWNALRGRRARPKRSEREELDYLTARVDGDRAAALVEEEIPYVGRELFAACVGATGPDAGVARRIATARRLERALQPHARYSRSVDCGLRIVRRVSQAVAWRTGRVERNRLAGGGAIIAVLGGDGSGKTTALDALERWLASEFDVRLFHLGKPRWSATTTTVRAALKAIGAVTGVLERTLRVSPVRSLARSHESLRPLVWLLCTARDRRRTYRRARRFAVDGGLVLCDRYPHPRLRSMEVPLIATRSGDRRESRVVRAMIRLEQRYHRSIAPPELLVVLRVDPEIAVKRKTTESAESVRARGAEIWDIDWRGSGAIVVDASRPADVVARELKTLVWSTLA